jgi:hypothetical protein
MNSESNFWISEDVFDEDIPLDKRKEMYRSSIKNFVKIITNKDIPVQFKGEKSYTDGKHIWIDEWFDVRGLDSTIGIVLHESCHIIHSDFNLFKTLWMKVPREAISLYKSKKFNHDEVCELYKNILNYVEDRFIDNWAYEKYTGYRGYYQDLYNRFWNNTRIGNKLESDEYRDESIESYLFRVINLTNKKTDLSALNGLEEIYNIINLGEINRLSTPLDRLEVASNVLTTILRNVEKKFSESKSESGDNLLESCEEWLNGNYKPIENEIKSENSDEKKESAAFNKKYDDEFMLECNVNCILIKNVNVGNLDSLELPIATNSSIFNGNLGTEPVNIGIALGKILATRWCIRRETNKTISTRQRTGRIDKRLLFTTGFDNDKIFFKQKSELFKKCHIHISIDASGSMRENEYGKWKNAIICAVAIAKAASVTENVEVVVSFRTTITRIEPYPCLVVAYDSRRDKFNKIHSLFHLFHPGGGTPEGLLFPLISSITPESNHEMDVLFINFSDGMPYFRKQGVNFSGISSLKKTKEYFEKLKISKGVSALSYYIGEDSMERIAFSVMYGKDSNFIDVKQIIDVAKTITNRIIKK